MTLCPAQLSLTSTKVHCWRFLRLFCEIFL